MFKEFKAFVMRGNVLDLAVAVILGAAFGKIVTSFVEDVLMPPLGLLLGKVDFGNLFVNLGPNAFGSLTAAKAAGAPTLNYGVFLNAVINFLIVGGAIFLLVRTANRLHRHEPPPPPTTKECPYCRSTIALQATRCAYCTSQLQPGPPA